MAVTKIRGTTQIMEGTITNAQINDSASIALTKTDLNANSNKITNVANGTDSGDAINYSQLQDVATQGKAWKEVVFIVDQLKSGVDGGIYAAQVLKLSANLETGDVIYLNDGTNTETFTMGDGSGETIEIGADINATLANLEVAIDGGTIAISADTGALSTIDDTNNVLVIWQDTIGETTKIYVNDGDTASRCKIAPTTLLNMYEAGSDDMVASPTSLPGTTNFGFYRTYASLTSNETHMCRVSDESWTWDDDANVWNLSGSTSIPYASTTEWGKAKIGDGIAVTTGIISIDLTANEGLILTGSSPNKTVSVDYDDSTIGIVTNKLAVKASGITNSHLANSTITMAGDSGSNAVDLGDTFTYTGGTGITTEVSGDAVTITGDDATTITKGIASFATADFDVTTGAVSLKDTVVKTVTSDSGSATPSTHGFGIKGGTGITTSGTGADITITGDDAAADGSTKGVAAFASDDFDATSGVISLDNTVAKSLAGDTGTAAFSSHQVTIAGTDVQGIDTSATESTVTITAKDATTAQKGVASYNSNHFSVTTGAVSLLADGIDDTLIDWGTGAGQVNALDVPLVDSSSKFIATTVEDALEELFDTQAGKYAFKTISVSGQDDVVADAEADTLTFVAGTDITITTTAGSDSITIASSGSSTLTASLGVKRVTNDFELNYDSNAGITLNGNVAQVKLDPDGGLEFNSVTGIRLEAAVAGAGLAHSSGVLSVNVDETSLHMNTDTIEVKTDGIDTTHIDWGSGANQVDLDEVPDGTTYGKVVLTSLSSNEIIKITDASGDDMTVSLGGADRVLTLNENLTVGDGYNVTLTALGQADSITLNESLTIGDGYDGTLTYSASGKTLTVEGDSIINQDLSSDSTVAAFTTLTTTTSKSTTFDTNVAAAGVTLSGTTLAADGTDDNIDISITPKGTGNVKIDNLGLDGNSIISTNTDGDINLTPNGTGEVNISKVDIDAGTIDGATIATSNITVGSGKTLTVSAGTLVLGLGSVTGSVRRFVIRESVNETPNGAIVDFTVGYTPIDGSEQVFLNGLLQNSGGSNDYTLSESTITFVSAPLTNDQIVVSYWAST